MSTFFEVAQAIFLLSGSVALLTWVVFMWRDMR